MGFNSGFKGLISSVRTAVSCVCYYSISMADTDIDAIRK